MIVMMTQNWGRSKNSRWWWFSAYQDYEIQGFCSDWITVIHPYQFYSCLPSSWQHFKNHSLLCVWGQLLSFLFEPFPSHVPEKGFLSFTFCVKVSFSSTTKHPQLMLRHVTAIMGFSWVGALGSRMLHWPLGWFTAGSPARWGGDGVQTVGCEISALNVWIGRIDTIPSTYSMIHNMLTKKAHIIYTLLHTYMCICTFLHFFHGLDFFKVNSGHHPTAHNSWWFSVIFQNQCPVA